MKVQCQVVTTFNCSLERAFKTPILGDATQFLTGYGLIPAMTHFTEDATWGQPGGTRIPHSAGNFITPKGELALDTTLVREENTYWKWALTDFKVWNMFFLAKAQGEWFCSENDDGTIAIKWVYNLYPINFLFYPCAWLLGKLFWKGLMQQALPILKQLAESEAAYNYE